jgi:hypothetical protein
VQLFFPIPFFHLSLHPVTLPLSVTFQLSTSLSIDLPRSIHPISLHLFLNNLTNSFSHSGLLVRHPFPFYPLTRNARIPSFKGIPRWTYLM